MPAGQYSFLLEAGATWERLLSWTAADGTPVPLAGLTARMQIRSAVGDPTVRLELTTENGGILLIDPGQVHLTITAERSSGLGIAQGVYALEIVDPRTAPERVVRLLEGRVRVSPEVTREGAAPLPLGAVSVASEAFP